MIFFHQKRLVFDECDRMLELGYKRDVQSVLNAINDQSEKKRQTLLLSATLTQGIEEMSSISLKHPKFIDAATVESNEEEKIESLKVLTTPENLQQTFTIVPAKLRLVVLASFILWKSRFRYGLFYYLDLKLQHFAVISTVRFINYTKCQNFYKLVP